MHFIDYHYDGKVKDCIERNCPIPASIPVAMLAVQIYNSCKGRDKTA